MRLINAAGRAALGVGMGRRPVRYLRAGEAVESTVEGIGPLRQRCVAGGEDA
jgi:2-keto-4-pentenoate hydratase/2-oxohepta-3-ene-1,7-dioic acid hydratase in catechol pathway